MLIGVVAAVVAACRPRRRPAATPPPDNTEIHAAIADETALLAGYAEVIRSHPGLGQVLRRERTTHERHLAALRALLPAETPTPTPPSEPSGTGQAALRHLLTDSATRLSTAAIAARVGDVAAVLASIAASHQVLGSRLLLPNSHVTSLSARAR